MNLDEAQRSRARRAEDLAERRLDQLLDDIGLSDEAIAERVSLGTADVSPAARKKLRPIIDALRKDPTPFTTCLRHLRDEQPGWSDDRRKKTCNVLKALAGRSGDRTNTSLASFSQPACAMLDDESAALLEMVDMDVLDELDFARSHDGFAALTAKGRKALKKSDFVFPKHKRYPIHDLSHAKNALARSAGKPEENAVKAAVYRRYPQLKDNKEG